MINRKVKNMSIKIYLITNHATENKMYYVGQTINEINDRFTQHVRLGRRDNNCLVHEAILEYGKRNFTIEILEVVETQAEADIMETFYIKKLLSHYKDGYGYNMKYEMSDNKDRYYHGADINDVNKNKSMGNAWNKGIPFSDMSRKKMSETKKHRNAAGLYSNYGHKHTEETKKKLSDKAKNRPSPTDQTKNKWREQSSGRQFIHNLITKERKSVKDLLSLPEGWSRGRGTCWINDGMKSISIDVWDVEKYLHEGFNYGRIC